jgi:hypothetical protein
MKHIQNFNKFNEEVEMGMLPTDVVRSAPDVYKDVFSGISDLYGYLVDKIGDKMEEVKDSFKGISEKDAGKIAQFMKKTFGTVKPKMNKENIIKLTKALGFDRMTENFKENENMAVKIIGRISQVLGINIATTAGLGLSVILTFILDKLNLIGIDTTNPLVSDYSDACIWTSIELMAAGWAASYMFDLIMRMFGYFGTVKNLYKDLTEIGDYYPNRDIRNKY